MFYRKIGALVAAVLICLTMVGGASAQALDKIVSRGKILVGIDLTVPPYGYLGADALPAGSDVDVAKLLAADLGVELEIVPVTQPNRIPYLLTDKIDVVLSSFSITAERAKTVTYSNPYGLLKAVILAPADLKIEGAEDLKGLSISVTRGSITDMALTRVAPEANIMRFDDEASTQAAFMSGQTEAMSTTDAIALVTMDQHAGRDLVMSGFAMQETFYAVGLKRNDPDFLRWLNTFIFLNEANGKLGGIYKTHFKNDLPKLPVF